MRHGRPQRGQRRLNLQNDQARKRTAARGRASRAAVGGESESVLITTNILNDTRSNRHRLSIECRKSCKVSYDLLQSATIACPEKFVNKTLSEVAGIGQRLSNWHQHPDATAGIMACKSVAVKGIVRA